MAGGQAPVAGALQQLFETQRLGVEEPVRNLDYIELFAGDAAVSRGLDLLGLQGWSLDMRHDPKHDFLTPEGFRLALEGVARLRPGGLLWAAPPCSTWVFHAFPRTGRHLCPEGRDDPYVQAQNALVCRLLLLSAFARSRGAVFIWEQPGRSTMWQYGPLEAYCEAEQDALLEAVLEMGAYKLRAQKDTKLWGTAPYIPKLAKVLTVAERQGLRQRPDRLETAVTYRDEEGRLRTHGAKDLKETQAYTLTFGASHALAYVEWRDGLSAPPPSVTSPVLAIPLSKCWFFADFHDATFAWHKNIRRENQKRPRPE